MAKVKVKKQSTFIDMTAMSDVTVLLLTFFMLTSTFLSKEPVQVTTPASVSEFQIPETNKVTILLDNDGKVFLAIDNQREKMDAIRGVGQDYGIDFTDAEISKFTQVTSAGVPIADMKAFLTMTGDEGDKYIQENMGSDRVGIPMTGREIIDQYGETVIDNEFKHWIKHIKASNKDVILAIKADQNTPYSVVQKVIDNLREIRENRYILITTLKTASNQ